jgi:hypothetical protein
MPRAPNISGPCQFKGASCEDEYTGALIKRAIRITGRHNTEMIDHFEIEPKDLDRFNGKT